MAVKKQTKPALFALTADGRLGRSPFWVMVLIGVPLTIGFEIFEAMPYGAPSASLVLIVLLCFSLYLFLVQIFVSIRRLHDMGQHGWFVLLFFVPFVNIAMFLWLGLAKGDEKKNEYGDPPNGWIWFPK